MAAHAANSGVFQWFKITFDKPPTIADIDHMLDVITVARKGYIERAVRLLGEDV